MLDTFQVNQIRLSVTKGANMAKKIKSEKITIDDKQYDLEKLSDEAKAQLLNIQFVDSQLLQLQNEWAVCDTARIGYENALKSDVSKTDESG